MILSGDIGGTNTRLAIYEKQKLIVEKRFPSQDYSCLEDIVEEFLKEIQHPVSKACFGVAGPVREGRCKATNLPWVIDTKKLKSRLNLQNVALLNDLEAKAYGVLTLDSKDVMILNAGKENGKPVGNQALVAAGTGLGEAGLFWDGKKHCPFACEGGHVDFAPRNHLEVQLLTYLLNRFGHASYERVVSGPGIYLLYQFLTETGKERASLQTETAMKKEDPPKVIFNAAVQNKDPASIRAIDWFLSLYGAVAGNMALQFLSLGGFYIGGAIARSMADRISSSEFLPSFFHKGRFESLLKTIPIYLILAKGVSLRGSAYYAVERMKDS